METDIMTDSNFYVYCHSIQRC